MSILTENKQSVENYSLYVEGCHLMSHIKLENVLERIILPGYFLSKEDTILRKMPILIENIVLNISMMRVAI